MNSYFVKQWHEGSWKKSLVEVKQKEELPTPKRTHHLIIEEETEPKIGELCWFWDNDEEYRVLGILFRIEKNADEPYGKKSMPEQKGYNMWRHCRPAKDDFIDGMYPGKIYED